MGSLSTDVVQADEERQHISPTVCGPFFSDPVFANSWDLIGRKQNAYEEEAHLEHGKYSVEKDLAFRSKILGTVLDGDGPPAKDGKENSDSALLACKENFQVIVDIQNFRPEELQVSVQRGPTENEAYLLIEGKHEENAERQAGHSTNAYTSRHFVRTYKLPTLAQRALCRVGANISSDGILQVVIPWAAPASSAAVTLEQGQKSDDDGPVIHQLKDMKDKLLHLLPDFHLRPFWDRVVAGVVHAVHPYAADKPTMGIQMDREWFRVLVDVKGFDVGAAAGGSGAVAELRVAANEYNVTVEGEHGEKKDGHGSVLARKFRSTYELPRSVRSIDELECNLLPGGVLEIKAPKVQVPAEVVEKEIVVRVTDEAEKQRKEMERLAAAEDDETDISVGSMLYWTGIPPC